MLARIYPSNVDVCYTAQKTRSSVAFWKSVLIYIFLFVFLFVLLLRYWNSFAVWFLSLRHWNTGLVYSEVSLTSWGEGASLAMNGHSSSEGITTKIPYRIDVLLHHPIFHLVSKLICPLFLNRRKEKNVFSSFQDVMFVLTTILSQYKIKLIAYYFLYSSQKKRNLRCLLLYSFSIILHYITNEIGIYKTLFLWIIHVNACTYFVIKIVPLIPVPKLYKLCAKY